MPNAPSFVRHSGTDCRRERRCYHADMSSGAHDAVRAAMARISDAWQARRYDDLRHLLADDMVFTLPGFQGRLEGRDSIVAS
jgi:hypothetical protein